MHHWVGSAIDDGRGCRTPPPPPPPHPAAPGVMAISQTLLRILASLVFRSLRLYTCTVIYFLPYRDKTSLRKNLTSQSRIATTASRKIQEMVSVDFRNWPMHFDMNRCTSKIDRCTCIDANWCGSAPGHVLQLLSAVTQWVALPKLPVPYSLSSVS